MANTDDLRNADENLDPRERSSQAAARWVRAHQWLMGTPADPQRVRDARDACARAYDEGGLGAAELWIESLHAELRRDREAAGAPLDFDDTSRAAFERDELASPRHDGPLA
jgi:hypothetical protein